MVHISPQREDRGERKKTEAANMFKALLYTQTHTHTGDGQLQQGHNPRLNQARLCVDVCVIPRTPLHLWVGHKILNTLAHVYFHH